MNIDNHITKFINDNINKNSSFEFIVQLKDLTLSDIDCIEEIFERKSKLTYKIVDNIYIKISYLNC